MTEIQDIGATEVEANGADPARAPEPTTATGGQLVVDTLRALGVRKVFGIPGGQTLAITDAILDTPEIDFVTARHEGGAACMADAVGRLTGVPGVCLATTGPGATNLLTGVGGAFRDSSPVLVITCNNKLGELGRDDAAGRRSRRDLPTADEVGDSRRRSPRDSPHDPRGRDPRRLRLPGPVLLDFTRSALEARVAVSDLDGMSYPSEVASRVQRVRVRVPSPIPSSWNAPPSCWPRPRARCCGSGTEFSSPVRTTRSSRSRSCSTCR